MESHLGLFRLCSISPDQVSEYCAILHRTLLCPLVSLREFTLQQPCAACPSLAACFDKCNTGIMSYASFLMRVVADDAKKPRHAYYDGMRDKNNIAFVSDSGVIVIGQKKKRQLIIKTGYRCGMAPFSRNSPQAAPAEYYLNAAKMKFKNAARRGSYNHIRYVAAKNW